MPCHALQAVVFDLDGTLVDHSGIWRKPPMPPCRRQDIRPGRWRNIH